MISPLNSPLEVGIRVLALLTHAYPAALDLDELTFYDYAILHSADLGGPASLHPALPAREGELGVKLGLVEEGIQVMLRASLIEMIPAVSGIRFRATENSYSFVSILSAPYVSELRSRINWALESFGAPGEEARESLKIKFRERLNYQPEWLMLTTGAGPRQEEES
jgi:hypothetical protein